MSYTYPIDIRHESPVGHVYIGLMSTKIFEPRMMASFSRGLAALRQYKIDITVRLCEGGCHVDDARNEHVARFMATDATWLLFIDSDVDFSVNAIGNIIQLARVNATSVLGATYPFKDESRTHEMPVLWREGKVPNSMSPEIVEVDGIPTGFMLIHRKVLVRLYEDAHKEHGGWALPGAVGNTWAVTPIFYRGYSEGNRRSGDYQFCHDARKAGFKIHCWWKARMGHTGTKTWEGSLWETHLRENGTFKDRWEKFFTKGEETIPGFIATAMCKDWNNEPYAVGPDCLTVFHDLIKQVSREDLDGAPPTVWEVGSGVTTTMLDRMKVPGISFEESHRWAGAVYDFGGTLEHRAMRVADPEDNFFDTLHLRPASWPQIIFVDGPTRKEGNERFCIFDFPEMFEYCDYIIVDDADDKPGFELLDKLKEEYGYEFQIFSSSRRDFALGIKHGKEIIEAASESSSGD
jgi:hypothetical protein